MKSLWDLKPLVLKIVIFLFIVLLLVGIFLLPKSDNKKQVRFDSDIKVGTIYGNKMDRFNPELKSLFEKNMKEAIQVGGTKNLAAISYSSVEGSSLSPSTITSASVAPSATSTLSISST